MQKVVYISGGTRGLGAELSQAFASHGYRVHAFFHSDLTSARKLTQSLSQHEFATEQYDVTSLPYVFPDTLKGHEVTVLHNACAAFTPQPFHLVSQDAFWSQFLVGVKGLYNLVQPALKISRNVSHLKIGVILSEALNLEPPPKGFLHYRTAKLAMENILDGLAAEYEGRNISFFKFYPPYMETDLTKAWSSQLRAAQSVTSSAAAVAAGIFKEIDSKN